MRKILALMIIASLSLIGLPSTAAETITEEYDIPSGPNPAACGQGVPCALATRPCAPEWRDEWWLVEDNDPFEEPLDSVIGPACATLDPLNGGADDGLVRMGIFSVLAACGDCYTDFQVSISDLLPTQTFYRVCIFTDYQDGRETGRDNTCGEVSECTTGVDPNLCDDIPDPSAQGCSSAALTSPVPSGGSVNEVGAFVYASFVDETTGAACLGLKGALTVEMS